MKRGFLLVTMAVLCVGVLAGCAMRIGNGKRPLPADPVVYTRGEFVPEGENTGYTTLENGCKVFMPYGTIRSAGPMRDQSYAFGDCLGYVEGDENDRIYALSDDPDGEWIIEAYQGGIMDVPMVFRDANATGGVPESVVPFEEETE